MILYDTFDILARAGIDCPSKNGSIRLTCPICGTKTAFSITRGGPKHGWFKCFHCDDFKGGAYDFFNIYFDKGYNTKYEDEQEKINLEILDFLDISKDPVERKACYRKPPELPKESTIAAVSKRDEIYRKLFSLCGLSKRHEKALKERGFTEDNFKQYRSVPPNTKLIMNQLLSGGYDLHGIPGFFKKHGNWQMSYMPSGIFIPVYNEQQQIKALNVRLDQDSANKYLFFSSANMKEGCESGTAADGSCHIPGKLGNDLLIIEGLLKADIAHHYLPETNIAGILGSNSINSLLELIEEKKITNVYIALDMDQISNRYVNKNMQKLKTELNEKKVYHTDLVWDARYKGIDDYLTRTN